MKARPPYDHPESYPHHWVWTGWDGVYRWIDRDGSVHLRPILPEEGCPPRDMPKDDDGDD